MNYPFIIYLPILLTGSDTLLTLFIRWEEQSDLAATHYVEFLILQSAWGMFAVAREGGGSGRRWRSGCGVPRAEWPQWVQNKSAMRSPTISAEKIRSKTKNCWLCSDGSSWLHIFTEIRNTLYYQEESTNNHFYIHEHPSPKCNMNGPHQQHQLQHQQHQLYNINNNNQKKQ